MKNKQSTVSIEEAMDIIISSVDPLSYESVSIMDASNRVLYEDIISNIMLPPLDDSAMDGYAVVSGDTCGATSNDPVKLKIVGEVQAGGSLLGKRVIPGTAVRIMTGAPIPDGADSVIQFEDTQEDDGYVRILREVRKFDNYRFAGESIRKGDTVLSGGERLTSADIGLLASLNYKTVKVYRQPTVSIISTGDEIAEPGDEAKIDRIRNVNAYTLYSEIKKYSAIPDYLGIARDARQETREIFRKALKSDVVISTGGVSMGRYDFVKDIYDDLDIETQFEWVRVKPGRPCTFGKKQNTLVFGLPGNPVSTLTSFIQFVRPALLRLMGTRRISKPIVNAFLEEDFTKQSGKTHLLRGHFRIRNNEFYVSTTGNQKSSVLRSMSKANCLIIIPENITRVKMGERVAIQLIAHDEV